MNLTAHAALIWLAGLCVSAHAAAVPPGLIGQFRSAPKKVCIPEAGGKVRCSRIADRMTIERTEFGGGRDVKVTAEFMLPDARLCTFEGWGGWAPRERSVLATDPTSGCELSLTPVGRELKSFVIRGDQCDSPCAGRSWLDGVSMRKR